MQRFNKIFFIFHKQGKEQHSARRLLFLTLIINSMINISLTGQTASEYEIKAVYIEKVARFIQWPENTVQADTVFRICVAGKNPFGNMLEKSYQSREIKHKKVVINYVSSPSEIDDCHLLYIGSNCDNTLKGYLEQAAANHILVFSDIDGYGQKGVHVNFYPQDNRILFEINLSTLRLSGLDASSYLLDYARIVKPR